MRRPGTAFGTRCEIKNLNSIRSVGRAIDYEARRQIDLIEAGETIRQQTRHWIEADGRTHTLRVKEDADDYRYFPEPDLVPIQPSRQWIERCSGDPAVLPAARRRRLVRVLGHRWIPTANSSSLLVERGRDDYVMHVIAPVVTRRRALCTLANNLADRRHQSSVRRRLWRR